MKLKKLQVTIEPDEFIGPDALAIRVRVVAGSREWNCRQVIPPDDFSSVFDRELRFAGEAIKEHMKTEGILVST